MSVKFSIPPPKIPKTNSFKQQSSIKNSKIDQHGYGLQRSGAQHRDAQERYAIRFQSKLNNTNYNKFDPGMYLIGQLTIQDVVDLKEVFDSYDSTGMGVLLPNDLKLLLTQNGFQPNKKTVYEIVAQFDAQQTGGINFAQFMKAMDTKPYINESKKQIGSIFKKYDRANKGFIDINDLKEINRHLKENVDDETLKLILEKADSNHDGKMSFEDFYSVMVKIYY